MKRCPVCSKEYADDVRFCPNDGQTLRASGAAASLVGQVLADRYHVVKKLGEGGMGQVYLAEHVKMGRRSAIKVMNPAMVHDPEAVARFNREAANASRITHPNVCGIYDFGETAGGLIYLAMEFVEGEPLTDLLEREGALPVPRAATIFLQVADALQAAHDLGIVHRDLKPDNVMVARRRSGGDAVKVVDFGIAKAVGGDVPGQQVTKTGLVVGTPEFMSPEQLSGDAIDGRSDLYALALVFYRMLTGKLPFEATTAQEAMIKRLTDEPATLAAGRPDLHFPSGLQAVFDTALARNPLDRYQSVAKFAADVAGVAGSGAGGPTAAIPETRPRRSADPDGPTQLLEPAPAPRRKRSLALVAAGAVVVLGAGGAGAALLSGRLESPAPPPAPPPPATSAGDTSRAADTTRAPSGTAGALDPRRLADTLDVLVDRLDDLRGDVLVTAARGIYDAPGIGAKDQAMAAYLVATGHSKLGDQPRTCEWARRAVALDPDYGPFRALRQSTCS